MCVYTHTCMRIVGKDVFADWVHLVNTKDWNIDPKSPRVFTLIVMSKNTDKITTNYTSFHISKSKFFFIFSSYFYSQLRGITDHVFYSEGIKRIHDVTFHWNMKFAFFKVLKNELFYPDQKWSSGHWLIWDNVIGFHIL